MKLEEIVNFQKALADETRVRILMSIYQHELCLCHISNILSLANSTLSKHLDILRLNGLILKRKEGKYHYFCFNNKFQQEIEWLLKLLENDQTIINDKQKITQMIEHKLPHLPEIHAKENINEQ
jgi:ArsR family transcriptional regulator